MSPIDQPQRTELSLGVARIGSGSPRRVEHVTEPANGFAGSRHRLLGSRVLALRVVSHRSPYPQVLGISTELLEAEAPVWAREDVYTAIDTGGRGACDDRPRRIQPRGHSKKVRHPRTELRPPAGSSVHHGACDRSLPPAGSPG